jgi:hypothetical protein
MTPVKPAAPGEMSTTPSNLRQQLLGLAAKLHRRVDLHLDATVGVLADLFGPRHQEMLHRVGDRRQKRMQPQSDFLRCGGCRRQRIAKRNCTGEREAHEADHAHPPRLVFAMIQVGASRPSVHRDRAEMSP